VNKEDAIKFLLSAMDGNKIRNFNPTTILKNGVDTKITEACAVLGFAVCANGSLYRKNLRGFLPTLMDDLYKDRKTFKTKMIKSQKNLVEIQEEMKRRGLST